VVVPVVGGVGFLGKFVPFRREYAVPADRVEAFPNATDAGKKINEVESAT
jgi:hypothetical protein